MMDDGLSTVVRAFREENTASRLDASAIRQRVLSSYRRKPHGRPRFAWFFPAAVLLLGSTALAANGAVRLRLAQALSWLDRSETTASVDARNPLHEHGRLSARSALGRPPATESSTPAPSPSDSPPAPTATAEATTASVATSHRSEHDTASQRQRTPPALRASASRTGSVGPKRAGSAAPRESHAADQPQRPPTVERSAEEDADLARYRAAHELHFQAKDPNRALAAWDAYLAAFPKGKLAVEAHFNRALCLIKLGRTAEAEALLQAFATGAFGSYRRTRAADLLDALRRRHAEPTVR